MTCSTRRTSTAYCSTDRQFRSVCTTTLATLRCTNSSPGSRLTISLAGTRLSAQPIQRKRGDCCRDRVSKNPGSRAVIDRAQARLLSSSCRSRIEALRSYSRVQLIEMMAQVRHVVRHQEAERDRRLGAAESSAVRQDVLGRRRDHVRQVTVVRRPQRRDVAKGDFRVALTRDPRVLVVAVELEVGAVLTEDEAPVVVARRVDEMAEDLARAPCTWSRACRRLRLFDAAEHLEARVHGRVQIGGDRCWRHVIPSGPNFNVVELVSTFHMIQMPSCGCVSNINEPWVKGVLCAFSLVQCSSSLVPLQLAAAAGTTFRLLPRRPQPLKLPLPPPLRPRQLRRRLAVPAGPPPHRLQAADAAAAAPTSPSRPMRRR